MKNMVNGQHQSCKNYAAVFIFPIIFLLLHTSLHLFGQLPSVTLTKEAEQLKGRVAAQTKLQLLECGAMLNYPKSVERFYRARAYSLAWVAKDTQRGQVSPAMMILDCVSQFGLNSADFHPRELVYRQAHVLAEQPGPDNESQRAVFDILLTDAMITFMNYLHYGKFNPFLTPSKVDVGDFGDLRAEINLSQLMDSGDFYNEIGRVQPNSKEYDELQRYMHLVRGQYIEDSYEFPEKSVRKMTINMERLRWLSAVEVPNLIINIPAFEAKLKLKDITHRFKVMVGKPSSPTPLLERSITQFTVAPEWKVPSKTFIREILPKAVKNIRYLNDNHYTIYDAGGKFIEPTPQKLRFIKAHAQNYFARQSSSCGDAPGKIVFRIANTYNVYLHDTSQPKVFLLRQRGISHGCIGIDRAEKLAALLMVQNGSSSQLPLMKKSILANRTMNFFLKTPVPIKLVYLTCEMIDSQLVIYNDLYAKDREMEMAMYGYERLLASDRRISSRP